MHYQNQVTISRWYSETPLTIIVALISLFLWVFAFVSVVLLFYIIIIVFAYLLMHTTWIAHVRGNGVKVNEAQFPEMYQRINQLCQQFGLKVPEIYVLQAGGLLNAMATRFVRTKILVIYSDLLEACGENTGARDMILAHELGHIEAGHLAFQCFMAPGILFPFLGKALMRAREYTSDRYGLHGAGNVESAITALKILAAGGQYGPKVSTWQMVQQMNNVNTAWMRIGEWSSTHPLLIHRIWALDPSIREKFSVSKWGTIKGLFIVFLLFALIIASFYFFFWTMQKKFPRNINRPTAATDIIWTPQNVRQSLSKENAP